MSFIVLVSFIFIYLICLYYSILNSLMPQLNKVNFVCKHNKKFTKFMVYIKFDTKLISKLLVSVFKTYNNPKIIKYYIEYKYIKSTVLSKCFLFNKICSF